MKCRRPNCTNVAWGKQGLCAKHYRVARRGYRPAEPVRTHLEVLLSRGWGFRELADETGLTAPCLHLIISGEHEHVRVHTWDAIMAVPVPDRVVSKGGLVDATGTRRRIQGLAAIGWPQTRVADRAGISRGNLSNILKQRMVHAKAAAAIADVYDELSGTPGPNQKVRDRAARLGWVSPFAWDEGTIDDPAATPNVGTTRQVSFIERYREVRYHVGLSNPEVIAKALGITPESLKRQIERYRQEIAS